MARDIEQVKMPTVFTGKMCFAGTNRDFFVENDTVTGVKVGIVR